MDTNKLHKAIRSIVLKKFPWITDYVILKGYSDFQDVFHIKYEIQNKKTVEDYNEVGKYSENIFKSFRESNGEAVEVGIYLPEEFKRLHFI